MCLWGIWVFYHCSTRKKGKSDVGTSLPSPPGSWDFRGSFSRYLCSLLIWDPWNSSEDLPKSLHPLIQILSESQEWIPARADFSLFMDLPEVPPRCFLGGVFPHLLQEIAIPGCRKLNYLDFKQLENNPELVPSTSALVNISHPHFWLLKGANYQGKFPFITQKR